MARTFRDAIAEDISAILNPDEFAELVTYLPLNGASREDIAATVTRQPPEGVIDGVIAPMVLIRVANDEETGIASDEWDSGGDKIEIADREGAEPEVLSIVRLVSHDFASCRFEVR